MAEMPKPGPGLGSIDVTLFASVDGQREQARVCTVRVPVKAGRVVRGVHGLKAYGLVIDEPALLDQLFGTAASIAAAVKVMTDPEAD